MDVLTTPEIGRSRSAFELIGASFALYRRFPWLFLALAAAVVIPFDLISLLGGTAGPLNGPVRAVVELVLFVADVALVLPLISALHVHAIDDVWRGRRPEFESVARRGLATLPVVSAAALVSWLGIMAGLVALIIPGFLLFLRWAVVAQAAALGSNNWREALARSRSFTRGLYPHVFGLFFLVVLITAAPGFLLRLAFGLHETPASFLVDCAVGVATSSFGALAIGLLFFDLQARYVPELDTGFAGPGEGASISGQTVEPTGHSLDPGSYSDEDRPPGWYVNPDAPWRMRYWAADGKPGWSKRTTRTPKQTQATWRDLRWKR